MAAPRVKMRLVGITALGNGSVTLNFLTEYNSDVAEDQTISAVFPSAQLNLVCTDAPTIAALAIGAAYYADFSLAAVQPANPLVK